MLKKILCLALLAAGTASCCCINEDLSDCPPKDQAVEHQVEYELQLITNITTELETELSMQAEAEVQQKLRQYLSNIFTDYAHDIRLNFYNPEEPHQILEHFEETMNANQKVYVLTIPRRPYRHLGIANLRNNTRVNLEETDFANSLSIRQKKADAIGCHETGLFSARYDMDIAEEATEDQIFHVRLYMLNCAAALVLDNATGVEVKDVSATATGFYSDFQVNDSTYLDNQPQTIVRADPIRLTSGNKMAFCTVNMPSGETPMASRIVIETEEPFLATELQDALWQYRVYVTMPDGKVTESILGIRTPLRAGQLKIIKGRLTEDGSVEPYDATVGVSVTLNWNNGGEHEVEL